MTPLRIGVDVGGTNTDAVVMAGTDVVAWAKRSTTADVTSGIVASLEAVLGGEVDRAAIAAVMIGTTHFTNAIVQRRGLTPVAVFRLCGPATLSVPPMLDWPAGLRAAVEGRIEFLPGGFEFDGRPISDFDGAAMRDACRRAHAAGLSSVVIVSVFAPVSREHEERAAAIVAQEMPGAAVTLSSEIGRLGLIQRENAAIMNGCLRDLGAKTIAAFRDATNALGLTCPLYLSQNDGTLMSAGFAERFPVHTFASGPTNSMRGAAFLSRLDDAIVVDIGGTTTDVGALSGGFPRESAVEIEVAGVVTNFRMPDVLSFGLGGGSLVDLDVEPPVVGPLSVGYELASKALVFGGDTLTATDIAVAGGRAAIGEQAAVARLDAARVRRALETMQARVERGVDRVKVSREPVPVVLVGGGSVLVGDDIAGASRVVRPPHFDVANAIGAAIAQVSGEVEHVASLSEMSREVAIEAAKREAAVRAVAAGADPRTVRIVDIEEAPLAYLPSNATRVKVKAVGDLAGFETEVRR